MASASAEALAKLEGVYHFEHPGGAFDVHLRSKGRFFCPKFQAKAEWHCTEAGELEIKWGKYGEYKLDIKDPARKYFEGSAVGKPESWRKMGMKRPFSTAELGLFDSVWELEHPGGKFNVEFRADGYNHCACSPASRSHTRLRVRCACCARATITYKMTFFSHARMRLSARSRVQRLPCALALAAGQ